ncbi:MAG: homocysteine S-methyltransferase family protein [Elusimicrobia bacterium]|nr:homocysteine S-methyltransferase family protein [Elusimicrobiota bacterium]
MKLAKEAVARCRTAGKPRFVAGAVGPTNKALFVTGGTDFDEFTEVYFEQITALLEGGADLLLIETAHDILNIKAALAAASKAFAAACRKLPVIVSVTMDRKNTMLSGQDPRAVHVALEHFPLFALGFNCSTGPEDMALRLEELSGMSGFPVLAMPNAGLPDENGRYNETPEKFARTIKNYALGGFINIAGGCCGTTPAHIKALAEALKGVAPRRHKSGQAWAVSGIEPLFYSEIDPPLLAGERNNSIGSKKFRDVVAAGGWDQAVEMAKAQVRAGAHILDVCLSNPDRNEPADVKIFLPMLFRAVRAPVMIDTTDIKVMEEVLKLAPGKCVLNSVNFEFGPQKPAKAAELVKLYGAKLVVGLIDEAKEQGLPLTAGRKLAIARRAYDFFTNKCALRPEDIIFDALVFPVGVGGEYARSAGETLKAVELIKKEFPLTKTALGVSNVSFGLPPESREILNAVFLHHAIKAGLDIAIVNVEKHKRYSLIPARELELAENLIFARAQDGAAVFAGYFREKKKRAPAQGAAAPPGFGFIPHPSSLIPHFGAQAAPSSPQEKLYRLIMDGSKAEVQDTVRELLAARSPLEIINGPVLKAMAEVGKLFAEGELIITEVLQSAEATASAVSVLGPALKAGNVPRRGKLLLATVKGDVHDIGKNLVHIIFESNGFEVIDLGVKAAPETITASALAEKPDFIGLSGLLVRSTEQMAITARELAKAGVSAPLLAGGAALTEKFVAAGMAPLYKGPVFYAPDAMDGLNTALKLIMDKGIGDRVEGIGCGWQGKGPEIQDEKIKLKRARANAGFRPEELPEPKDLARHFFGEYPLPELFAWLDEDLFNLRFLKLKKTDGKKAGGAKKLLAGIKDEIIKGGIIKPRGVYRFFPAAADGDSLLFYGPDGRAMETINFPRQHDGERLCIADFIALHGGQKDHVALLAVSCGEGISEFSRGEREKGNYLKSYIVEALALSLTEAFAEVLHHRIRADWGFAEPKTGGPLHRSHYRGRRYSFGWPPCPDLSGQRKLFNMLKPEGDVGIKLTEHYMMEPEASVSAFALHNPKAKYFNI